MKRVTKEDLRSLYAPMSDEARQRSDALLQSLCRNERKEYTMKKKLFAGVALAMAMLLTTATALAASGVWDVRSYFRDVFQSPMQERMESCITEVEQTGEAHHTVLTITSAYWDGRNLAFDWQVENKVPEEPVYLWMEEFTCNDVPIWTCKSRTHDTDDFNNEWLPGVYHGSIIKGGERILLPENACGEKVHIRLVVKVWKPASPIQNMEALYKAQRQHKSMEWWVVDERFQGFMSSEGEPLAMEEPERFIAETMTLEFTLESRGSQEELLRPLQSHYETDGFTLEVLSVKKTALEISVDFRAYPDASRMDAWALTDLEGNALPQGEDLPGNNQSCIRYGGEVQLNGVKGTEWHASWPNYNEVLADGLAIAYRGDGQEMLFPILQFNNQ